MSTQLQTIKSLLNSLPKKDIPYAKKFLETRDIGSLKDLVWSALLKAESGKYKEHIDIDSLRDLAAECVNYYYLINPEELEDEEVYDEGFEDYYANEIE